ncbi:DUF1576 domain-containing protein [Anaerosolibacter sp.]|uniref:DUF1576 domain-containing protein n=1 Tax=Anaerosolibacter sp. TaxID=1872527 RepID=UPI0039F089D0
MFGFLTDSPSKIATGLYRIIVTPDILITDYMAVGGIGAAFINSGLLTLVTVYSFYRLKINLTGASLSTIWIVSGFALFGKNIFNVWFIILGVWLYAKYQRDKFTKYVYIAFLGTSLAPIITQVMFGLNLPRHLGIPLGILIGLSIGFILPALAPYLMKFHQGFNLYNIGFTAGILGTIISSLFRSYGLSSQGQMIWATGYNPILSKFLIILFLSMIVFSFGLNRRVHIEWKNILDYSGRLVSDFVLLEGFAPTLFNMGIGGIISTIYVLVIGADLNGPTVGGIFTIVGFSAFGKHIKNMLPIVCGVFIGSLTKTWHIADPAIVLAALFGTTLAPIAGEFGWRYGILAGFLHSSVVLNVGYLHSGFNLYNNGFSGGIVAAILIPIIEALRKDTDS